MLRRPNGRPSRPGISKSPGCPDGQQRHHWFDRGRHPAVQRRRRRHNILVLPLVHRSLRNNGISSYEWVASKVCATRLHTNFAEILDLEMMLWIATALSACWKQEGPYPKERTKFFLRFDNLMQPANILRCGTLLQGYLPFCGSTHRL